MAKEELIEVEGRIKAALPNAKFSAGFENDHSVEVHISGKVRKYFIRILPGDKIKLELFPYDLTKGRITYRKK